MKVFNRLVRHIEEHKFLRGAYKGAAPLFTAHRRSDTGVVHRHGPNEIIVLHDGVRLVTILRDGERESIMLTQTNGYSNERRKTINQFLHIFLPVSASVTDEKIMGTTQVVLRLHSKRYRFFNGITFNSNGKLLCSPEPFTAWRIDRARSATFKRHLKESGFDAMFPLLCATVDNPARPASEPVPSLRMAMEDADFVDWWPYLIANSRVDATPTGEHTWDRVTGQWTYTGAKPPTPQQVYAFMVKRAKADLYRKIETDIFELPA